MGNINESAVDYWLTDDGLLLLSGWARDGYTKQDIADRCGVTRRTFTKWCSRYPEIEQAMSQSREIVDMKVENALLKAALGYKTKEIKVTLGKKVINGETYEVLKETTTKEVAPNVNAAIMWLTNRNHDKWKRNRDRCVELGEEDQNINITIVRGNPEKDGVGGNVNTEVNFKSNPQTEKPNPKEETWDNVDEWDEE